VRQRLATAEAARWRADAGRLTDARRSALPPTADKTPIRDAGEPRLSLYRITATAMPPTLTASRATYARADCAYATTSQRRRCQPSLKIAANNTGEPNDG